MNTTRPFRTAPAFISWIAGLLALAAPAAAQMEFHRQNPINSFGGLSSQDARNPGGLGWFSEVADNFPGQAAWNINHITFWGGYATPAGQEGNTEGFTVRFYTDAGGHPGARIYEQDFPMFTETLYYTFPGLEFAGYIYEVDMSPAFDVPADGQLWVSVVAILARGGSANEPQWGWIQSSQLTPPPAEQWFFAPGMFAPQGQDVAFVLSGSTGPKCRCDINQSDGLNSQDFFDFLAAFFAGSADFNQDGTTDSQDFFDFLTCFFTGC